MSPNLRNQEIPPPYSNEIKAEAVDEYRGVSKATGHNVRSFVDIDTGTNIRSTFTRKHYEYYRPEEAIPERQKAIIAYSMDVYRRVGPLYNIINLMADFASQGIKIVHRSPQVQRFYRHWAKKVGMKERSERFCNLLLRAGTTLPLRVTAQLKPTDIKTWRKTVAKPDIMLEDEPEVQANEIPVRYIFLNPLSVEVLGSEYTAFTGSPRYALRLNRGLVNRLQSGDEEYKEVMKTVPTSILEAIKSGESLVPLDPNKLSVYFYKKDDWQQWADPLANVVLDDIILLEKMKLCDLAAVDGSISSVRLWTIGDLEHKIFPTRATIARLNQQLTNNVGGGVFEMIWGPELKFQESASQTWRYLGKAKYESVYEAINQGLGIPSAMSGNAGAGFTNNYIQLKTLVERLQYVRNVLTCFWENEMALVQKALGHRHAAQIHFDKMVLSDEAAEKKLLLDMADRDMISLETVLERYGEIPEIEKIRLRKEGRMRTKGSLPQKAGPFHNAMHEHDLRKIFSQLGVVTPSQMGLDLEPNKAGEVSKQEQLNKIAKQKNTQTSTPPKGQPGQGRPKNSKDTKPRKQKRVLPKTTGGAVYTWAYQSLAKIGELIEPVMLSHFKKENLRKFTREEFETFENTKAAILYDLEPFSPVTLSSVKAAFDQSKGKLDEWVSHEYRNLSNAFTEYMERPPSIEECRQLVATVYLLANIEFTEED